jgi:TRAP-type mannitol/chloroaromatic compound transport system permease small subunit
VVGLRSSIGKYRIVGVKLVRGNVNRGLLRWSKKAKRFIVLVDAAAEKSGKVVSLLVVVIMVTTVIEVVARYAFHNPTNWAWPINLQFFAILALFGGVYTLRQGGHIRVEMLYKRFPPKMKLIARLIALACFLIFIGVLVWQGGVMAQLSLMAREWSSGAFKIPLYPFRILLPIAAFLFLLEGIADFIRNKGTGD